MPQQADSRRNWNLAPHDPEFKVYRSLVQVEEPTNTEHAAIAGYSVQHNQIVSCVNTSFRTSSGKIRQVFLPEIENKTEYILHAKRVVDTLYPYRHQYGRLELCIALKHPSIESVRSFVEGKLSSPDFMRRQNSSMQYLAATQNELILSRLFDIFHEVSITQFWASDVLVISGHSEQDLPVASSESEPSPYMITPKMQSTPPLSDRLDHDIMTPPRMPFVLGGDRASRRHVVRNCDSEIDMNTPKYHTPTVKNRQTRSTARSSRD